MSKQDLLKIFAIGTNEFKAVNTIIKTGKIYNYEFHTFVPICLSHTKVIHRVKIKLEAGSDYTIKTHREDKSNRYFWTIELKEESK